jgi:hypothetical protein
VQPTNTPPQPSSPRPDPVDVARIVNAAWSVTRDRLAADVSDWSAHFLPEPDNPMAMDIERIVAALADFSERLRSVELLADYAAERAESNDGG